MSLPDSSPRSSISPFLLRTQRPHLRLTLSPLNSRILPPHPTARQPPIADPYSRRRRRLHHTHHSPITILRPRPILPHTLPHHHMPASLETSSLPRTWPKSSLCHKIICLASGFANHIIPLLRGGCWLSMDLRRDVTGGFLSPSGFNHIIVMTGRNLAWLGGLRFC